MTANATQSSTRRRAMITGASRGLGRAVALACADAGWDLILACHERARDLDQVAAAARSRGAVVETVTGDLTEPAIRDRLVALARSPSPPPAEGPAASASDPLPRSNLGAKPDAEKHPRMPAMPASDPGIDLLAPCAGVTLNRLVARTDEGEWDRVLAVNLVAVATLCRACLPLLRNRAGLIALIGSHAGARGQIGLGAYGASKAALTGWMEAFATEAAPEGVRVNLLLPGFLDTEMGASAGQDPLDAARRANLLGRLATPEAVARFCLTLVDQPAISGQVFALDSRPLARWR